MYCPKCGKKLDEDDVFCYECGTKIVHKAESQQPKSEKLFAEEKIKVSTEQQSKERTLKEGRLHKCPKCGETLEFDATRCPSCGYEVRDREVTLSIHELFERIQIMDDEDKKIELIKTFPIPNSREDLFEFMLLAKSNYDAEYFVTNRNIDSISSAWMSKIEQCYLKAKIILKDKKDIDSINEIYNGFHETTRKAQMSKLMMILSGFVFTIASLILIVTLDLENQTGLSTGLLALLTAGIVLLVFGFKKKKTSKQLVEEKGKKKSRKK